MHAHTVDSTLFLLPPLKSLAMRLLITYHLILMSIGHANPYFEDTVWKNSIYPSVTLSDLHPTKLHGPQGGSQNSRNGGAKLSAESHTH